MNRRNFIALASGLLVPWQPERVYSFLPAWRLLNRDSYTWWRLLHSPALVALDEQCPNTSYQFGSGVTAISPANLLDVTKTAEAFGQRIPEFLNPSEFCNTTDAWDEYRDKQRRSYELGHDVMRNMDRLP